MASGDGLNTPLRRAAGARCTGIDPTVLGVESMSEGTMVLRILLKTGPDKQWGPMREARARAQRALAAEGVRGPILPGVPGPRA